MANSTLKNVQADQVSDLDSLDRTRFAKEIAANIQQYLNNNSESLVIGIHGAWGSGKSTLLHFIKEEIEKTTDFITTQKFSASRNWFRVIYSYLKSLLGFDEVTPVKRLYILDFNPWVFSGKEQLHSTFLNEFALKVESRKHKLRTKIEAFAKGLQLLEDINSWGGVAKKTISKFSETSIEKLKEETNGILKKENIHIIIVMDDLDRLAPAEILEVFQLVKLNANFVNTLFLISFDKKIVSDSIYNQYKLDGEKYLEKIVQVDYSLPSILSEDIETMFFSRLQLLLNTQNIQFETRNLNGPWLIHGLRQYFKNIRDLNRYFNSINFRLPAIHAEINIHDFLIIEAIRLFDYASYEIIKDNFKEARQFGNRSKFQRELDNIQSNSARELYLYLFEKSNQYNKLNDNRYRIFDPEFFDRYFTLTISKKDMREEEFNNFVLHPPTRPNLLDTVIRNGKIEFLLRRLTVPSDLYEKADLLSAISPLLSAWGDHKDEFLKYWRSVWDALKAIIATVEDKNVGYRKLLDELNAVTSDFSPARFVFLWLVLENIYREDDKNVDKDLDPFVDLLFSRKDNLERTWKALLENYQPYFLFSDSYNILYQRIFLPSFAKYHPDKYEQQFRQLINDDQRIFKILNQFTFRDSTTREPFGIDPRQIEVMLPGELRVEFEKKLESINPKTLSKEDAKTVKAALTFLKEHVNPFTPRKRV